MIYIFEGCDRTGKTTAATKLSKKLNIDVARNGCYSSMNEFELFDIFYNQLKSENIICDRSFLSEVVYSHCMNRKNRLDLTCDFLLRYLMSVDHIIYYYDRDIEKVVQDNEVDANKFVSENVLRRVSQEYRNLFNYLSDNKKLNIEYHYSEF